MTGRGRPRKAKCPDTKCVKNPTKAEETKQGSLPRCPGKAFTEEKQNGTTKEQKPRRSCQKKPNHNEEKPSVQGTKAKNSAGRDKSPELFEEVLTKVKPERPKDIKKDSLKTTKAKTCSTRAKSPQQFTVETIKKQPEMLEDTTMASLSTKKAKAYHSKAKSPEQIAEEIKMTQPDTPNDTTKDLVRITKAKAYVDRTNSTENSTEETTKKQRKSFKNATKACEPQDKDGVDSILKTTLEKLKIKKNDRSDAAKVINNIVRNIMEHLKNNSQCFKEVEEPLRTGSYYEHLKVSHFSQIPSLVTLNAESECGSRTT